VIPVRPAFLALTLAAACGAGGAAHAAQAAQPVPDAMANQPDPRDYVTRADTNLTARGNPMRFGGMNISWLGLRDDTGRPEDARVPTDFEVNDALKTVQIMGAGTIRVASLAASAGCALCLTPSVGQTNPDALARADHLLRIARDAGLKIVVPLAGAGHCAPANATDSAIDPVSGTQCVFAHARGLPESEFYTDPNLRAAFTRHVVALLNHLNPETGLAWKDDPTIMAWENCDDCGQGMDNQALAGWTEFLGQAIKSVDTRHLYENGAFAGRIGAPGGPDAAMLALPSVDIIGDLIAPPPGTAPDIFTAAQQEANKAGRVYLIDSYAWTPAHWATTDNLVDFLAAIVADRAVAGALLSELGAHADQGGWLPPTRPDQPVLNYPGAPTGQIDTATVAPRARAIRRFSFSMMDLSPIAFAQPDPPQIISAIHGKLVWRGAPGATTYSVSRSTDVIASGSWETLCEQCVTDANPSWQDPSVPSGNVWYRLTPYNSNLHNGLPSAPAQDK
jgi:hypothetical protein